MLRYRPEIDGLRAVAVVPVIAFHAGLAGWQGGFVGVDVFFVLSGYLVTLLILADGDAFSLRRFYERRARRILPALLVVLTAAAAAAWWWLLPADLVAFSKSLAAVLALGSNVYFWRSALDYFAKPTELTPLLHTWSLAVEEQYYLFFPLVVLALRRLAPAWLGVTLVGLAAASFTLAQWATTRSPNAAFFLLPTRGWELLVGAWLAWRASARAEPWPVTRTRPAREALASSGLVLIGVAVVGAWPGAVPGLGAIAPVLGTALVIIAATPDTVVGRVLAWPALVGLGLVSYSAYLWHQPLFAYARVLSPTPPSSAALVALAITAFVLAALTWRYVEQPWRDRRRTSRRQLVTAVLTGAVILTAVSAAGVATRGALFRYDVADRPLVSGEVGGSAYVVARFDARRTVAFDAADPRPRLLVIGDSFAQDVVNALFESGVGDRLQISTRYTAHYCGNLLLPLEAMTPRPDDYNRTVCEPTLLTNDATLPARLRAADVIWLASMWQDWQVPLLPQSLDAMRQITGDRPIVIFGTKSFGTFRLRDLLGHSTTARAAVSWPIAPGIDAVNSALASTLRGEIYVDLQRRLCGNLSGACRLFTPEGALVSYDGAHLTPDGARFLGRSLAADPVFTPQR